MTEENKNQPDGKAGVPSTGQETGKESAGDIVAKLAEVEKTVEALKSQLKEKDTFIGRQSTEIGELRKLAEQVNEKTLKENPQATKSEIVEKLTSRLIEKRGMDAETAKFNAEMLAEEGGEVAKAVLREQNREEFAVMVEDALDDGIMDKKIYGENEKEIMEEFKGRKLTPSARQNFKILKRCYEDVIRRKADSLRQEERSKEEKERQARIDSANIPAGQRTDRSAEAQKSEDDKAREAIRNADSSRSLGPIF